ncbi:C40 family peptidase [Actinokineospora xionganensis]|uniref:C40 family peptidase n=1 Tax=Actinokineospora xionganensis TaxID=2684470 RepID=A0ABR7LFR4_9PSEU|nr:C40 family peptidase [Actinokineospora xionganensis]MBC6451570.1 C40 family peptidase [Actinokineospora xionganensis]
MTMRTNTKILAMAMIACLSLTACGSADPTPTPSPVAADGEFTDADFEIDPAIKPKGFPAKVDINGRKKKGQDANAPGHKYNAYKAGQLVPVKCQSSAAGEIWDYTTDGWWVPDKYVKTGTDGWAPGVPRCGDEASGGGAKKVHGRNNGPAGPTTGTRAEKIKRVIDAAKSQTGKGYLYSWGAGGKGGPSYGVEHRQREGGDDYYRYGYDCSGFTLYAFWKGAGIDIGPATTQQYAAGKKVPLNQLEPGDLIFWGSGDNPGSTTHVAMFVGNGKLIEASWPRDASSVRIKDLYGQSSWTAHAIRVI